MTVQEVILRAAELVGVGEKVENYFAGIDADAAEEIDGLLKCYNAVENEVALDHLPLVCEETLSTDTGAVYFSELEKNVVHILCVQGEDGRRLSVRTFPQYFETEPGVITVRYSYAPTVKAADEETETAPSVSARLLAYGVASEYCLLSGLYEESAVWGERFSRAIAAAYKKNSPKRISARRWA